TRTLRQQHRGTPAVRDRGSRSARRTVRAPSAATLQPRPAGPPRRRPAPRQRALATAVRRRAGRTAAGAHDLRSRLSRCRIWNIVATAVTRMRTRIGAMGRAGSRRTTTTELGRRLSVVARVLPVATVACWAITIVVPVLDSGEPDSLRIRVTSLGFSPIDMNDLDEAYLLLWAVVLIVAITAWLLEASRWWSVAAIVLGTVLSLRLLQMIVDPPYLVWEGQTASGTPTGGMEVAYPALGFGFWVFGSMCFIAAGVCGLIADAQRTRDRR